MHKFNPVGEVRKVSDVRLYVDEVKTDELGLLLQFIRVSPWNQNADHKTPPDLPDARRLHNPTCGMESRESASLIVSKTGGDLQA